MKIVIENSSSFTYIITIICLHTTEELLKANTKELTLLCWLYSNSNKSWQFFLLFHWSQTDAHEDISSILGKVRSYVESNLDYMADGVRQEGPTSQLLLWWLLTFEATIQLLNEEKCGTVDCAIFRHYWSYVP